eukprot:scaffold84508_cov36-Phaeocystis_antarctica.AAC.1
MAAETGGLRRTASRSVCPVLFIGCLGCVGFHDSKPKGEPVSGEPLVQNLYSLAREARETSNMTREASNIHCTLRAL